jgi:hypothetical protein
MENTTETIQTHICHVQGYYGDIDQVECILGETENTHIPIKAAMRHVAIEEIEGLHWQVTKLTMAIVSEGYVKMKQNLNHGPTKFLFCRR